MDTTFVARLTSQLDELKAQGLYKPEHALETPQRAEIRVAGLARREVVNFCANNYLGLANHPEVVRAFTDAAHRYGVGSGASHLVTGHGPEHEALEAELAAFCGRERALVYSTGYWPIWARLAHWRIRMPS